MAEVLVLLALETAVTMALKWHLSGWQVANCLAETSGLMCFEARPDCISI